MDKLGHNLYPEVVNGKAILTNRPYVTNTPVESISNSTKGIQALMDVIYSKIKHK